ncbi:hypothetical protein EC957_008436 [Mortierella hygrophila]|uniref:Uncharacterized protein n=1 Tax=Mortierella hygrophila TaxID=979708 RepID=A0A9P6K5M2_9FUNG|nr:hypothetical protein EC957_008436 [Mortierella hygrophila]
MESPLDSLTFNALQGRPVLDTHAANHDLARLITRKWEIYAGDGEQYLTSSMDGRSFVLQKKEGDNLEKIVFQRDIYADLATLGMSCLRERIYFDAIGSPMCLYRLGCTFPSGVHIDPSGKSAWWSGFTHKSTGRYFGITDIKGSPALRTVRQQSDLNFRFQDGQRQLFDDLARLSSSAMRAISQPYLEELPKELVDHLSDPDTGDVAFLKKLQDLVDTNNIFTSDIAELLGYLASDQCVHGYGDLVAGCEEREP